jgi:hypothetical protein
MKILPVGSELFYAEGRTGRQKAMMLMDAFRCFAKASENNDVDDLLQT